MAKEKTVMSLPLYKVNAFVYPDQPLSGNPAAIVILEKWLEDEILLSIANKINLSETAFLVGNRLRWFTPKTEVALCGHATLATAFVLANYFSAKDGLMEFATRSDKLPVYKRADSYTLDFPATNYYYDETAPKQEIEDALGTTVSELFVTHDRYICIVDTYEQVAMAQKQSQNLETNSSDLNKIAALPLPGLIITTCDKKWENSADVDFVSRFFAPAKGVPEDPVTGTSHCALAPLWGQRLGKTRLKARQISRQGGEICCDWQGDRVHLTGQARAISSGSVILNGDDITIEID